MIKKVLFALAVAVAGFLSVPASAQSGCQYIVNGAVLTAAQWNACFAAKNNTLGYTPLNKAGDFMTGPLVLAPSTGLGSSMRMPYGVAPNTPVNGDFWMTASGLSFYANGLVTGPFNTPTFTGPSAPSSPKLYSFWNNTTGATIPYDIYDGSQWVNIGTLNPSTHVWTAASGGSVTSFSAGTTGFTPSTATTGAVTLAGVLIGANGGTGVANTGKTITVGANLVTTGAGATTLAFGSSTQTYTFPTTTATLARTDAGQTFTGTNTFGVLTATSFNGNVWTTGTGTLTLGAGKTHVVSNSLTFTGTDSTSFAFPSSSDTVVTLAAAQTLTNKSIDAGQLTGTILAARLPAFGSGDVSFASAGGAGTIASNAVTNAKSAQMAANTMKGNWTGSTANAADNAMPACTDSGSNHLNYVSGTGIICGTSAPSFNAAAATIASASTTDLNSNSNVVQLISGTTNITSFGTGANLYRNICFTGTTLVITYNATSLITPTKNNIQAAAGDCATLTSDGSGNWTITSYTPYGDSSSVSFTSVSITSLVQLATKTLTPGKWAVSCIAFVSTGTVSPKNLAFISLTTASSTAAAGTVNGYYQGAADGNGNITQGPYEITVTSSTPYYCNANSTGSGANATGFFNARRVYFAPANDNDEFQMKWAR